MHLNSNHSNVCLLHFDCLIHFFFRLSSFCFAFQSVSAPLRLTVYTVAIDVGVQIHCAIGVIKVLGINPSEKHFSWRTTKLVDG